MSQKRDVLLLSLSTSVSVSELESKNVDGSGEKSVAGASQSFSADKACEIRTLGPT